MDADCPHFEAPADDSPAVPHTAPHPAIWAARAPVGVALTCASTVMICYFLVCITLSFVHPLAFVILVPLGIWFFKAAENITEHRRYGATITTFAMLALPGVLISLGGVANLINGGGGVLALPHAALAMLGIGTGYAGFHLFFAWEIWRDFQRSKRLISAALATPILAEHPTGSPPPGMKK